MFLFSQNHFSEIAFIINRTECFFCHIFMKLKFPRQMYEKYLNIKFHEKPCIGGLRVPCGRTDGQTDATKLIVASQFSEFGYNG